MTPRRWQEASYLPGDPAYLIAPEMVFVGRYIYPDPCHSRVPRGETPTLGDPEKVAKVYGDDFRAAGRAATFRRFRVLNLATGASSPTTYQSIRQAQDWAEEQ